MPKCNYCGRQLRIDARFCDFCGKRVSPVLKQSEGKSPSGQNQPVKPAGSGLTQRERLELARKLMISRRYDEAARVYYALEMPEKARKMRAMSRSRISDRRSQ